MTELTDMPFRTIGRIFEAIAEDGESYVYELNKKTGIELDYLYKMLPQMMKAGLLEYSEERNRRKYFTLTDDGRQLVELYAKIEDNLATSQR